ncbi:MAG: S41 family peptidase [Candidatus Azobacteroides sp.]|nr:S41 family peptidase [Candidatus Azobacteroides sp.]
MLSKHEMMEDMDSLEAVILHYDFLLPLMEERTNSSFKNKFTSLKQEISSISTTFDFTNLVRRGLNILNDGHTGITNKSSIKWFVDNSYLNSVGNVSLRDTLYADYYNTLITDSIFRECKSGIRAVYIDGKYYVARPFSDQGVPIKIGEEIKRIDDRDIHSFVGENYDQMFFLMWDNNHKRWYSDFFMLAMPLLHKPVFTLTIGDRDVIINSAVIADNLEKEKYQAPSSPKVMLLDDDMLYIYMPMMMNKQWYMNEIRKTYTADVKKIIIDIRNNSGGDDSVWADILSALIDKPFTYRYYVGMFYDAKLKDAISSFGDVKTDNNRMTVSQERIISPDSNSVHFAGKIFILQDKYTYSAASALVSAARQDKDRFTVIGEKSALISGYTFPPVLFKLKNSGIVFRLAFSGDITGGEQNKYMDKIDVEMQNDISTYLEKLYQYDRLSNDYLLQRDKLIQYVKSQ